MKVRGGDTSYRADTLTPRQLRALLADADDAAGHHILWVAWDGGVHLERLPLGELSPAGWAVENEGRFRFRLETFACGLGYVGRHAATDRRWVRDLRDTLQEHWRRGTVGYADRVTLATAPGSPAGP